MHYPPQYQYAEDRMRVDDAGRPMHPVQPMQQQMHAPQQHPQQHQQQPQVPQHHRGNSSLIQNGTVVGDGSWMLQIMVTDLKQERNLRVMGDMHIGGLMLRLVEELDVTRDWSDHALWWPSRRKWLTHTRSTLDQMGVTADSRLEFTPMHKVARIQLPDLQTVDARVDFSVPVFNTVLQLCKEIGIRYPEELSLKRYIHPEVLKKGQGFESDIVRGSTIPSVAHQEQVFHRNEAAKRAVPAPSKGTAAHPPPQISAAVSGTNISHPIPQPGTLNAAPGSRATSPPAVGIGGTPYGTLTSPVRRETTNGSVITPVLQCISFGEGLTVEQFDPKLICSPPHPAQGSLQGILRPKNYEQKSALNRGWLDSSRSLMEQGVFEGDLVLLRFKFMSFFDLNPKYDPVRLNQLFEQAKWSVIMEEMECTEEEALMFAALQLQALSQSGTQDPRPAEADDVDLLLSDLESTLAGVSSVNTQGPDLTHVPELGEYLRYMKPKKFTLKGWKRAFFTFRDLYLSWYGSSQESQGPPIGRFCLKGCEVTPDVNIGQNKYGIKLLIPSAEGMTEFYIKCDSDQQYSRFLAGCRLASKGKTMADASFAAEVESIKRLLEIQHPHAMNQSEKVMGDLPIHLQTDLNPEDYLPQRILRKAKTRQQIVNRILEAHNKVKHLTGTEAKSQFVHAWSALPEHGIHYFVVRLRGSKRNELLAVAYNRMMRMNLETGETLKTWRFSTMKKWHVNWEIKHVLIQTEEENVEFKCLSADCKVPHEFIGGYIFLSMRSKDQNQTLNLDLFHKLTGGWG